MRTESRTSLSITGGSSAIARSAFASMKANIAASAIMACFAISAMPFTTSEPGRVLSSCMSQITNSGWLMLPTIFL